MGKVFGKTIKSLTKNKATKQAVGITKDQLSPNSSFVKDVGKKAKSYLKDTFDNITLASKYTFNNQQKTVTLSMNGSGTINEFCDNLTNIKNGKININKTTSSNVTKGVSNSKVIYGELDSLGRPTGINATITSDMIGTGSSASSSIKPPGFLGGGEGHARGHLLGRQLGGSGKDPRNLVTLYQNPVNTPVMSSFERKVRKAVEAGETINYSATPIYKGTELVPSGVTLNAKASGEFQLDVTILNRK